MTPGSSGFRSNQPPFDHFSEQLYLFSYHTNTGNTIFTTALLKTQRNSLIASRSAPRCPSGAFLHIYRDTVSLLSQSVIHNSLIVNDLT